jgi:excisionase family DNA binding protein
MAGKFLSIEEAARQLNVSVEEVQRLVDRKKLFPMRDGATLKFKADEIERVAGDLADGGSDSDALALDLDAPAAPATPAAPADDKADDMAVGGSFDDGDWVFAASDVHAGSQTIVRAGQADAAAAAEASGLSFASDVGGGPASAAKPAFEDDLILDSIAAGSAIAGGAEISGLDLRPAAAADAGGMTLDLGNAIGGSGEIAGLSGIAAGSNAPGPAPGSAAGVALSGPLDSGLSLEDADINVSGIDLAAASGIASAIDAGGSLAAGSFAAGSIAGGSLAGGSLAGDAFDLGDMGDEESASVVIATDETGDSSFFGAALDDSASVSLEESSVSDSMAGLSVGLPLEHVVDTTFSVWQVLALACCTLLMLTAGLVMFDLASTIRAPSGTPLSAPLLNALSETLGWR